MVTADLAITYPRSLAVEFTTPFSYDPMVFMIPYPELGSTINRIVKPFQYQVGAQPAHAHRSDVDNSSIFCGKHRRKRYRPDIGNGTRVFDIDIVVRCTYDEIQTTIFHS